VSESNSQRSGSGARSSLAGSSFFLIHGDDLAKIENFKEQIVQAHLRPEERDENYSEYGTFGNRFSLNAALGDIIAELSTVSFLPDTRRVAVLYNPQELYEGRSAGGKAGRGKSNKPGKSAIEAFAHFIETQLPSLQSVLIVIVEEDYEQYKRVAKQNPIYQFAQKRSAIYSFKEVGPQFAFFDALFARKAEEAIVHWRDWLSRVGGSPRPYIQLASQLRLLIQAKVVATKLYERRGVPRNVFENEMLPADPQYNILLAPDWRRDKLLKASAQFSLVELLDAYEKLETLQKYAIPLSTDASVPDRNLLSEIWILNFCARKEE
jgi:hypothetical protein